MGLLEDYYRDVVSIERKPPPRPNKKLPKRAKIKLSKLSREGLRPLTRADEALGARIKPRVLTAIPATRNNQEEDSIVKFKVAWRESSGNRLSLPLTAAVSQRHSPKKASPFGIESQSHFFPLQLLQRPLVNISKWTLLATDDTFAKIAAHNIRLRNLRARNALEGRPDAFTEDETTSIIANGIEDLTDQGLVAIAKAVHQLEVLEIASATKVSDAGMRTLALSCSTLTSLNVSGCTGIAGAGLGAISDHCPKICRLSVAQCSHLDEWVLVRLFYKFEHLTHLDLAGCTQVTDTTLKTLAYQCRRITFLDLSHCLSVSDSGVVDIAQYCTRLETLLVASPKGSVNERITDIACLSLGEHCHELQVLNVSGCTFVSDVGVAWLVQGCCRLESLDTTHCFKLTDESLRAIGAGAPRLHTLQIGHAKNVSDVGLRFVAEGCPGLAVLGLRQLYLVSDGAKRNFGLEGLQAIAKTCSRLTEIDLAGCFQVIEVRGTHAIKNLMRPKRALKSLGAGCPRLLKVNLQGCYNATADGIGHLLHGCPRLETLNIANVQHVSNAVLADIARSCTHLKELVLSHCDRISDSGLRSLGRIADQLVLLNISGCHQVTDAGLMAFIGAIRLPTPALSHLILDGCPSVTDDFVNQLAFACPALLTLSMHGCGMSSRALSALKSSWKYTVFRSTASELGVFPAHRAKERRHIDVAGQLILAAIKIQAPPLLGTARNIEVECISYAQVTRRRCFRACRNKKQAQTQYDALVEKRLTELAIFVQRQFRATRRARLAKVAFAARVRYSKKLHRAAVAVQRRWRGIAGRQKFRLARAAKKAHDAAQEESATQLQALLRGRKARQEAARQRQQEIERAANEHAAATKLQSLFRQRLARRQLEQRRDYFALLNRSAVKMQCAWRARQGRNFLGVLRMAKRRRDEEAAATYIQQRWMARKHYLNRVWEAELRRRAHQSHVAAANRLKLWWGHVLEFRAARAQLDALLALRRRDEAMVFWAAQLVQSHFRRHQARRELMRRKEAARTSWKQMIDAENSLGRGAGAPYYYNQLNGDVRWRMPSAILTAQPQPRCDQCEIAGIAELECAHCGEYFCPTCSERIHGHGKRQNHWQRKLYNYYRRRVDYGDGDFPSWWPTEFEQDAMRPWNFIEGVPRDGYDALVQWIADENHRLFLLHHARHPTPDEPVVEETAPKAPPDAPLVKVRAVNEDSRGNLIVFKPIGAADSTDTVVTVDVPHDFDPDYGTRTKRRKRRKPLVARQKQILHRD
ncbi:hypothetical protein ACHHYP_17234 [Achlya hypogyna]|uniref:Uncharacterized protein n=1 Tax=Achlya hypogyna TaxID=1202772 RepID=A0A1V9Y4X0_ACHHY|nr:hypothetical protein ACHHYP_17234 [Achlya hypogyna]